MTLHKEGKASIALVVTFGIILNLAVYHFIGTGLTFTISMIVASALLLIILNFFRFPKIHPVLNDLAIIAPADGKVVVIEEVEENEYLKTKCIQVSVFMSPLNVHINWLPISGLLKYVRHHNGDFMAAYLPKSATENERTSVAIEHSSGVNILVRQVAGALARRICCYAKENTNMNQGEQLGFIKFGSRVDLYLPLGTKIDVQLNQKVKGRQTIIGWLK